MIKRVRLVSDYTLTERTKYIFNRLKIYSFEGLYVDVKHGQFAPGIAYDKAISLGNFIASYPKVLTLDKIRRVFYECDEYFTQEERNYYQIKMLEWEANKL